MTTRHWKNMRRILTAASRHYPDRTLQAAWRATKECSIELPGRTGDGLAEFIAREILEVSGEKASLSANVTAALMALARAERDLECAARGLGRLYRRLHPKRRRPCRSSA